jgi:hypothetical protein
MFYLTRAQPLALALALALTAPLGACGPGSPGGPSMNNRMNPEPRTEEPALQSSDILSRDAVTNRSRVQHILVSWAGRRGEDGGTDRTRADADALAASLLERVRAGEPMEPLMAEFSEDPGSAETGESYEVTPDAQLVFEFKRMGLRLQPGEAGLVLAQFGWHVMKRVE